MKIKKVVKKGLVLAAIYACAMLCVLLMAEKVERLEEKEKQQQEYNVAIKINK